MKQSKRFLCLLLVVLCLGVSVCPVLAARPCSLTIVCEENGTVLTGAEFELYFVAELASDGTLVVTEEFTQYHVGISPDTATWPQLASTLAAYAAYDGIGPVANGVTDHNGTVVFGDLADGIYLVVGDLHRQDGKLYSFDPILVALPGKDAVTGQTIRDVTMAPKAEWIPDGGSDEKLDLKVLKVWEDGEGERRPQSVTVHLLRDGKVIDTVELSEENRWKYTWRDLPEGHRYTVVEETVPGYTVTITRQGITFVVKNTAKDLPDLPDTPSDPDLPDGPIPETGQPWHLALFLTAAGLGFLVLGLYLRRRKQDET